MFWHPKQHIPHQLDYPAHKHTTRRSTRQTFQYPIFNHSVLGGSFGSSSGSLFKERWKRPYGSWAVEVDLEFKDDRVLKYKTRASKAVNDTVRYMSMNEGVIFQLVLLQRVVVVVCASVGLDVGYRYNSLLYRPYDQQMTID